MNSVRTRLACLLRTIDEHAGGVRTVSSVM